jgi:hypothetical protein
MNTDEGPLRLAIESGVLLEPARSTLAQLAFRFRFKGNVWGTDGSPECAKAARRRGEKF